MCKLLCGTVDYNMFDKLASISSPGAKGVIFVQNPDLLSTSISSNANGLFCNIGNENSIADLCRAVYEAFPYGVNAFWKESFPSIKPTYRYYAAGGGSRSRIRMQIFSDALSINQIKIHNAENSFGTAMLGIAAYNIDSFINLQQTRLTKAEHIDYNPVSQKQYLKAMNHYMKVVMHDSLTK